MANMYDRALGGVDEREQERRRRALMQIFGEDARQAELALEKTKDFDPRNFDMAVQGLSQMQDQKRTQQQSQPQGHPGRSINDAFKVGGVTEGLTGDPVQDMFNPARAGVSVQDANLIAADANALRSFEQRIKKENEAKAAAARQSQMQQQGQEKKTSRPHWADDWEEMNPGKSWDTDYEKATGAARVIEDSGDQDVFSQQAGGWRRGWSRMSQDERVLEMKFLTPRVEQFEAMRQQLTENYERMDPVARSHYNDMQKRVMGLDKARGEGKLNQLEYLRSMEELNGRAQQIKWKYHFRAPGAQPGEIIEQNGVELMRTAKGDLEPIAFTPQYIKERSVPLGNGKIAVPLKPGGGYEIMDEATWNPDSLEGDKKEFRKLFREQWKEAWKEYVDMNGAEPDGEELQKFEERVHGQTMSMLEAERKASETLQSRRREREQAMLTGQQVNQTDLLEEVMSRQFQETQKKQDEALTIHKQNQSAQLTAAKQQQQAQRMQQFTQAVQSAGDDPDARGQAIAQNWKMNDAMVAMANNPVVLRSKKDFNSAPEGRIYMVKNPETGKLRRVLKLSGGMFPLPEEN